MLCDKGLLILRADNYSRFAEAYTNLHKAMVLDPWFARPYAGLVEMTLREPVPTVKLSSSESMRGLADKLRKLASDLGATSVAMVINRYSS